MVAVAAAVEVAVVGRVVAVAAAVEVAVVGVAVAAVAAVAAETTRWWTRVPVFPCYGLGVPARRYG